jgi:hypothetical protein
VEGASLTMFDRALTDLSDDVLVGRDRPGLHAVDDRVEGRLGQALKQQVGGEGALCRAIGSVGCVMMGEGSEGCRLGGRVVCRQTAGASRHHMDHKNRVILCNSTHRSAS